MLVCHGESLGWVDLLLWEAVCWRWIDLAAVRTVVDLGGCWEKAWLVKTNNYCKHWRWWFVDLIWLLKARTTAVCWRWWLPPVGSTTLSVANGGGDDGTVDGRWRWRGRHWLRRCLCCCKPESMLVVMGVVGIGVRFDDGDDEQWFWTLNSRFLWSEQ
jgi:hypothetical protein